MSATQLTLILLACLTLLARAALALYAAGLSRSKNAAGAVFRNAMDLAVASLAFWAIGAAILEYLLRHLEQPEFQCRFHWEADSIALWDNRCTQHNPVNDYHGHRRVMHRVTLAGDVPR